MAAPNPELASRTTQGPQPAPLPSAIFFGNMSVWQYDLNAHGFRLPPDVSAIHGFVPGNFANAPEPGISVIRPDDVAGLTKAVADVIEQRGVLAHEFQAIWPDGSIHFLCTHGKVLSDDRGGAAFLFGATVDITEKRQATRQLQHKLGQLQLLFELAGAVSHAQELNEIYRAAAQGLVRALPVDRAGILIFDPDGVMRFKAWTGLSDEYRAAMEGLSPWARGTRGTPPIAISDVMQDSFVAPYRQILAKEGIRALAFIPLLGNGGVVGKFMLCCNAPHEFQPEELQVAQTIAAEIAFATEQRQAEIALRESEERFRATFKQAAVGIAHVSVEGEWLLVNDRFCEIVGYTPAELRGKTGLDITHPEDRQASLVATKRLLAGEISSDSTEKRYIRKDGTIIWGRRWGSLVRGAANLPPYVVVVVEDVSERVQAEQAHRDSERRLMLAQSAAHVGVWDCDLRTNVTVISEEYSRIHGLAPDHPPLTHEEWLGLVHPADREPVEAFLKESIGQTHVWDHEFRVVWPDGSVHWLLAKGEVFIDESGRPIRMTGVTLDITERKQAEAALRESEERFRNMADTAPAMIWVSGPDKLCTFFNKGWLEFTGRTLAQELGNGWAESVHPEDLDRCWSIYSSSFDSRRSFQMEYRLRRADGEYRWVLDNGVPRFDRDGSFMGYIGSCVDITDLKLAHEEDLAEQKLETVGRLAGGIAHDFNNLLGGVLAHSELGLAEIASGSSPTEELRFIRGAAIRGAEIVRQLMVYAGEETESFELVSVSAIVQEMIELLKVSVSKHVTVEANLSQQLPAVRANPAQIRQVVMNLFYNASEAIGDRDGVVSVTTSHVTIGGESPLVASDRLAMGDYVQLEVSDTGRGMTPEVQAKAFDPLFTTKAAGTHGHGLVVVKRIVERLHGTIRFSSEPGKGATFQILLPSEEQSVEATPGAENETLASRKATVLVVEDEDVLRQGVSKMLQRNGLSVLEASNGSAALDVIRAQKNDIDILLLDITLPGASSREVYEEARRLRPDLPVIITSAKSEEMAARALAVGIDHFLRKPFTLGDLIEMIRLTRSSERAQRLSTTPEAG